MTSPQLVHVEAEGSKSMRFLEADWDVRLTLSPKVSRAPLQPSVEEVWRVIEVSANGDLTC